MARTGPFQTVDWRFGVILGVSIATHVAFALHLNAQPLPAWSELQPVEQPHETRATLRPLPKQLPPPVKAAAAPTRGASPGSPRPSHAPEQLRKYGLLAPLTAHDAEKPGGAFEDVLEQAQGLEVARALDGVSKVKVANVADLPIAPAGPRTGEQQTIGNLGAQRNADVQLGEHRDSLVTGRVNEEALEPQTPGLDVDAISRFLAGRRRAVQLCYERELKHHPTLAGRLVVRLSISPTGRAADVEIEDNALGSDAVASCVRTLMRTWSFPVHPAEEAALSVPYIFSAAAR